MICRFIIALGVALSASMLWAQNEQAPGEPGLAFARDDNRARRDSPLRPNVVVLLADDLGYKDIGCYGGPVKTPTLDSLAASGARFTDFHSGCGVCSPSRATALTGRHHIRAGVYHVIDDGSHNSHLLEREVTLAEILKSHGYATAHIGKWHLGLPLRGREKPTPDKHGFDYWFATADNANPSHKNPANFVRNGTPVGEIEGYASQIVVDEAISWLVQKRDPDVPFFLNIWFHEPHAPIAAPDEIVNQYGELKDPAAIYSGTIDNTDRAIARLLAKIEELDSLQNTLIIYSSDNGSYREERNGHLRDNKGSNFEGGIRVPGICCWPGTIEKGHVEHEPAGMVDLLPTVCGLLGINKPEGVHLDGSDLSPLLTNRRDEFTRRQPLFWLLPTSYPAATVRDGRYVLVAYRDYEIPIDKQAREEIYRQVEAILQKENSPVLRDGSLRSKMFNSKFTNKEAERLRIQYVRLYQFQESWIPAIKSGGYGRFELFDLAKDIEQKTDLSQLHPDVVARLRKQLLEVNASVMADGPDWHLAQGNVSPRGRQPVHSSNEELLVRIDGNDLPEGYTGKRHQDYVDRRMAGLSSQQRSLIGQLWREKQRLDPDMPNRGVSFVKILEYVAEHQKPQKKAGSTESKSEVNAKPHDAAKELEGDTTVSSTANHPNVVVLLADDLGWKDIGCYGGPVKTPALDRLAAQGVRFTDFHSGAAVCSPSRATLLTGRQHLRAGVYSWIHAEQNSHLLQREVTLAEVLKSHGYETVHLGKWHLGMPTHNRKKPTPSDHGFDYWLATDNNAQPSHKNPVNFVRNGKPVGKTEGYACQVVVDEAITWLEEEHDSNKPFFLNVWFHEPHAPIAAPERIVSPYGKLNDPAAIYSGTIDNTDRAIARLLKKLGQVDSPENTLIVYSSDNGSYRADRVGHLRGTKGSNFEGGIRVPGILCWPGTIIGGHVEHEPAGQVDLLPTVCGLLGIDKPEGVHLHGSDLSPLLTGRADEFTRHQPLFWLLPASGPAVAIRDGNYSLVATRNYEFPKDRETMAALMKQIEETLRKNGTLDEEIRGSTLQKQIFEGFKDKEAEQLRGQYIRLNMFNESWIPAIKAGTYGRFELFDMAADSGQKTDVSRQHPEIVARLKKRLLEINASVMADAPDWHVKLNSSEAEKPNLPEQKKKNVLFVAVDDLNDWVGCLGGHPQAKTPNIDRLAAKGVLFEQAYCAAPLCNPSRTAIMTGLNPSTTGIYCNKAWFRDIPKYKDWETIPQYFRKHGYMAWTGGKIYHQADGKWSDPIAWDQQYSKRMGTPAPPPEKRLLHGMSGKFSIDYYNTWLDWAPIEQPEEETDDWRTADLAVEFLQQEHDRPFFLGCGFFRPHLTWYVPKKYFDMHPIEDVQLPPYKENDLDDVPPMGRAMAGEVFGIIRKHGQWKNSVQAYLAACSFADACVGHVLNALEKGRYRDNTIVVLWGDHGYHLGEKDHFAKSALWEEASRTPLIVYAPGVSKSQARCQRPVSLVDIYPTLIELCGLTRRDDLDGRSLAPLLRNPEKDWNYPAIVTHSPFWFGPNHAIRSQRYHYIHYRDGGEELYDNTVDPNGWKNLADNPKYAEAKEKLKKWLPEVNAEHFRSEALKNR